MIATQQINSVKTIPINLEKFEIINVLKWNTTGDTWKNLSPYVLKTDGDEICFNPGGVLFENFYQGCKAYNVIYSNAVYPPIYKKRILWWKFNAISYLGDTMVNNDGSINSDLYFHWRNSLWRCKNPIKYPNHIRDGNQALFMLCVDKLGNETKLSYIEARKKLYVDEYIRLIKKLPEYDILLNKIKNNQNIMICEIDVPAKNKKGFYGTLSDKNNIFNDITIEKLELLLNDPSEDFGHGLCLAYSLLIDTQP